VDKVEERFILQESHSWRAVAERVFRRFQRLLFVVEKGILIGEVDGGSVRLASTNLQKFKPLLILTKRRSSSSSRLSGRGGSLDAKWFSLRRKPFFRQGGSWAGRTEFSPPSKAIPVKPGAQREYGKRDFPPPSDPSKSSYILTFLTCVAKYQVYPNGSVTAELRSP
jgi:hypothetical protein